VPDQPQSIADSIESIYLDRPLRGRMKITAKEVADNLFSEQEILKLWGALVNSTTGTTEQ
jgi:hypothetical protein